MRTPVRGTERRRGITSPRDLAAKFGRVIRFGRAIRIAKI
jgi:hypothetical protein